MFGGLVHKIVATSFDYTIYSFNFSNISDISLSGDAIISNNELILTPNISNSFGSAEFLNVRVGSSRYFKIIFDYRIFEGNGADGLGFELSRIAARPLLGSGAYQSNGIRMFLDTYDNGDGVGIKIYRDNAGRRFFNNNSLRENNYRNVSFEIDNTTKQLNFSIDQVITNGSINLFIEDCDLFDAPANQISQYRLRFYAQTGGLTDRHSIKNLTIVTK
jgi:hypothetical protein